jgi:hypothetical protein
MKPRKEFVKEKIDWNSVAVEVEKITGIKKIGNYLQNIYTGKLQSKKYLKILVELLGEKE